MRDNACRCTIDRTDNRDTDSSFLCSTSYRSYIPAGLEFVRLSILPCPGCMRKSGEGVNVVGVGYSRVAPEASGYRRGYCAPLCLDNALDDKMGGACRARIDGRLCRLTRVLLDRFDDLALELVLTVSVLCSDLGAGCFHRSGNLRPLISRDA